MIEAIRRGQNVVLATPTASGKSLTYTLPALEHARDHDGRTLYIGPQAALINDQEATLSAFAEPFEDVSVTQYTGALSSVERQQARDVDPSIVLTSPDMLHCGRANEPLDKRLAATLTMALADPNRQGGTVEPKSD